jgi:hypothetical protein
MSIDFPATEAAKQPDVNAPHGEMWSGTMIQDETQKPEEPEGFS